MALKEIVPLLTGQAGFVPKIFYINTTDSIATVTTTGYLTSAYSSFKFSSNDMALVKTTAGPLWFQIAISGGVVSLVNEELVIDGSANEVVVTDSNGQLTGLTGVASAALVNNSSGEPTYTSTMTNGQVVIGSTGATPVAATITAGTGITITNAAGAITISGGGSGYTWTEVTTTSDNMAINNGYIANNASTVTLTLPVTAVVGSTVTVQGKGAGGWSIAQNAGQTIHFGNVDTTTGVGGSLSSNNRYDSVELICITADTDWAVLTGPQGSLTTA